jgi:hypothetical protein
MAVYEEHGFVGNVWVRQNWLMLKGDTGGGHAHHHDHVSLLVKGSVEVTVGDMPPKTFVAPTYIVIKKQHRHQIVALEDDTVFYCIFAMRDIDGEVTDIYQEGNLPNYPDGELVGPGYTQVDELNTWGPSAQDAISAFMSPPSDHTDLPVS